MNTIIKAAKLAAVQCKSVVVLVLLATLLIKLDCGSGDTAGNSSGSFNFTVMSPRHNFTLEGIFISK